MLSENRWVFVSMDFLGGVLHLDTTALILLHEILDSVTLGIKALNEIEYIPAT